MPSFAHEILVELFRDDGELAVELLRGCAGLTLDHARAELGSIDLSQVAPAEYRADAVVVLRDRDDRPVAGIVVEVQRRIDRDKLQSWPLYVAALYAKLARPVTLLIVAPDPEVAAWARTPISLGHPGFTLTPIVVGFADVPRVRDPVDAARRPGLAVLSALAHPELAVAEAAVAALPALPPDLQRLYFDVILAALPAPLRHALEDHMQRYEYQSEFARKYYGQGRAEGRAEGRADGLLGAILALAPAKLGALTGTERAALEAITDAEVLTALVVALGEARDAGEARAALAVALAARGPAAPATP